MKSRLAIITIIVFTVLSGNSQNMVNNPSFEEYYTNMSYSNKDTFLCKYWSIPNYSSVDYINKLRINICRNTNDSIILNQAPSSGDAFIGFVLFEWGGYLEQITGSLSASLIKDSLYEISFQLRFVGEVSLYRTKIIGVKFSDNKKIYPTYFDEFYTFYDIMYKETKVKADIEFNVLNTFDSTMWIKHKGVYKAKGGENFFTFGLFYQENRQFNKSIEKLQAKRLKGAKQEYRFYKRNVSCSIIEVSPTISLEQVAQKTHCASYYLIDDVSIKIKK